MAEQPSPPTTGTTVPSDKERRRRRLILGGLVAGIILLLAVIVGVTIAAFRFPNEARIARDLAIIFLAFLSIIIGLMILLLLYEVTLLILLLRGEIKPLLESMNETLNTVRGTAAFMSDNIVQPTIGVASAFAGVRRAMEALAGIRSSVKPKQRKE